MPNIGAILKQEIARIARKELRRSIAPARRSATAQRQALAALKRQIAALERKFKELSRRTRADGDPIAPSEERTRFRFRPKTVVTLRQRLGLSAEDFAKLVGVSGQTIYNWERGTRPRATQLAALADFRQLGKKAARAKLEAMNAIKKSRRASKAGKLRRPSRKPKHSA